MAWSREMKVRMRSCSEAVSAPEARHISVAISRIRVGGVLLDGPKTFVDPLRDREIEGGRPRAGPDGSRERRGDG